MGLKLHYFRDCNKFIAFVEYFLLGCVSLTFSGLCFMDPCTCSPPVGNVVMMHKEGCKIEHINVLRIMCLRNMWGVMDQ